MGFSRHLTTKKETKKRMTQNTLGHSPALAFSVVQAYSSASCPPAELASAYPDKTKLNPINNINEKAFPQFLGFR
jgi:hypothetical protein